MYSLIFFYVMFYRWWFPTLMSGISLNYKLTYQMMERPKWASRNALVSICHLCYIRFFFPF